MKMIASPFAGLAIALSLGACSAQEEPPEPADTEEAQAAEQIAEAAAEAESLSEFEGTAWRVSAEDGARYVTYLDGEGRYRDLRNGSPWQEGGWTIEAPKEGEKAGTLLCFSPDGENVRERCWEAGHLRDGKLLVTSGGGRRVELEKVAYEAPAQADPEA